MSIQGLSLTTLDTEAFRRKLAGLADPNTRTGSLAPVVVRETANRFCSILAHLFSDQLDRLTLWDKIGAALESACSKVSDDDTDRFITLCLEGVLADPGRAAACDALGAIIGTLNVAKPEDRFAFIHHIQTHRYSVLVHGRQRWERVKAKEIEL